MSVLNLVKEEAARNNVATIRRGSQAASDRPQAKVWLNVGYDNNGKFVNLPIGLPIDTMEPVKVNGQEDWAKFQTARNGLLGLLQKAGSELEPGQEVDVKLTVRLRHVADAVVITENEYDTDLSGIFSLPVAAAAPEAK